MSKLRKRYLLKQKLAGLFFIIATFVVAYYADGDATVGWLFLPVGLWFISTKKVILNRYNYIYDIKEHQRKMRLK